MDARYRLTSASGEWHSAPNKRETYRLAMGYDAIHNITQKTQQHLQVQPSGKALTQKKTSYDWAYAYGGAQPHAPTQIGERTFSYDANGNQTGWTSARNGTRRTITWDEENRIRSVADNGRTSRYVYDAAGTRILKRGPQGETAYVNPYFTVRNGSIATKHVFVGSTRLASKLSPGAAHVQPALSGSTVGGSGSVAGTPNQAAHNALHNPQFNAKFGGAHPGRGRVNRAAQGAANAQDVYQNPHLTAPPAPPTPEVPGEPGDPGTETPSPGLPDANFLYYYHPDHLGSASYVTDGRGKLYEHVQYFPFGETWVDQRSNTQRLPYLFTGKELDEDTGLYDFGARYYDPRTSVWQSADPILGSYFDTQRGLGGMYSPLNFAVYTYSHLNPVRLIDPDGNATGITAALEGNNYYLVAQTRAEICGYAACQANLSGGLAESSHGMHQITHDGQQLYLSPTWGDNQLYLDKVQERTLGEMSDLAGVAAAVPTPATPFLGALSGALKAGSIAKSDDKKKALAEAGIGYVGGKYAKSLAGLTKAGKSDFGGAAAEVAGESIVGAAVGAAADQRPGSAVNLLKATEPDRQQRQQQHLQLLNGQ